MTMPQASARDGDAMPLGRIGAMVRRHWYLISGSVPRLIDLAYWPTVQMLLWGFIQTYLMGHSGVPLAVSALLGAALLWDVFFRSQISLSISFLEEIWSRNLGHLMVAPLRPYEFLISLVLVSLARTLIGLVPASLLAIWVFHFSIYGLGFALGIFFLNLAIFGWTMGVAVAGLILRFGMGAETLAWALVIGMAPLCAVYYPIEVLPDWIEPVARVLPPSYVFEGLRALVGEHHFRGDLLGLAALLNLGYASVAAWFFTRMLKAARVRGTLVQLGE